MKGFPKSAVGKHQESAASKLAHTPRPADTPRLHFPKVASHASAEAKDEFQAPPARTHLPGIAEARPRITDGQIAMGIMHSIQIEFGNSLKSDKDVAAWVQRSHAHLDLASRSAARTGGALIDETLADAVAQLHETYRELRAEHPSVAGMKDLGEQLERMAKYKAVADAIARLRA